MEILVIIAAKKKKKKSRGVCGWDKERQRMNEFVFSEATTFELRLRKEGRSRTAKMRPARKTSIFERRDHVHLVT